ncbi:CLUMA_CG016091, isoform A [Clunio marinus]|uniref:CLUMA_CG016091, isoform A n=1 Tax=Clunio marinus TaxID=568069 RepID=A0A1J1IR27_9DIPT|nr:CLUMA_CG016091, isoform A [Clunio marinus]
MESLLLKFIISGLNRNDLSLNLNFMLHPLERDIKTYTNAITKQRSVSGKPIRCQNSPQAKRAFHSNYDLEE